MIAAAVAGFAAQIAERSGLLGRRVIVDESQVLDRTGDLALQAPGLWSPNGQCRLVEASDGWMAVNLPRESDLWAVPAWIGCALEDPPWPAVVARARTASRADLIAQARLLGLAVAGVGEITAVSPEAPLIGSGGLSGAGHATPAKVVDLSTLWAGPLCGGLLAQMGAAVSKVESRGRPDGARAGTPGFYARLNGAKRQVTLDFARPDDLAWLRAEIAEAQVVITSARPRAFAGLGLSPQAMFVANPGLIWVAVTGYGWEGVGADRVAFGDDAAAAGGLVGWSEGKPRFLGDALADPLTGLAAAAATLQALATGTGGLVDAALARTAAGVAA